MSASTLPQFAPQYFASEITAVVVPLPATAAGAAAANVADLALRLRRCCADAVDSLEIAARLEADGINDGVAAARYGHPTVFSLATRLYVDTPRRPVERAPVPAVWQSKAVHHLLRGVLFGLPGLLYVAASRTPLGETSAATGTIVFSLLLAWAVSEALSYLGYVRLGRGDPAGAARVLRRGLFTALILMLPLVGGAGWGLHIGASATAFAVGQACYLLSATAVLVTGGERWLLVALLPGVVGSAIHLTVGAAGGAPTYLWACAAATVLATAVLAIVRTRRSRHATGRTVSLRDVLHALPHAAFGLLAGGLLTFGTLITVVGVGGGHTASAVMALPLSLSMGAAEWLLFHYRRRTHQLMQRSTRLRRFRWLARGALLIVLGAYLTLLTVIADLVAWFGRATASFQMNPLSFWTSVLLGGALFTALALRSCGITALVLGACALTLAAEAVALYTAPWLGHELAPDLTQLVACTVLFLSLLAYACRALGRATQHR